MKIRPCVVVFSNPFPIDDAEGLCYTRVIFGDDWLRRGRLALDCKPSTLYIS